MNRRDSDRQCGDGDCKRKFDGVTRGQRESDIKGIEDEE